MTFINKKKWAIFLILLFSLSSCGSTKEKITKEILEEDLKNLNIILLTDFLTATTNDIFIDSFLTEYNLFLGYKNLDYKKQTVFISTKEYTEENGSIVKLIYDFPFIYEIDEILEEFNNHIGKTIFDGKDYSIVDVFTTSSEFDAHTKFYEGYEESKKDFDLDILIQVNGSNFEESSLIAQKDGKLVFFDPMPI